MPRPIASANSAIALRDIESRARLPTPQELVTEPWLSDLSPSVAVFVRRTVGGRLGHATIDIVAGMLLAGMMNWSFIPPGRDSMDVWRVFDFRRLVPHLALTGPGASPATVAPPPMRTFELGGACPYNWTAVSVRQTHWVGDANYTRVMQYLRAKVPVAVERAGRVCVIVSHSWRIMLHHYRAWEAAGLVRAGVYTAVTRALRASLRPIPVADTGTKSPALVTTPAPMASGMLIGARAETLTVAVHARRTDNTDAAVDIRSGKSTAVVTATLAHLAKAASRVKRQTTSARLRLEATIFTETRRPTNSSAADSNDVWMHGCPLDMEAGGMTPTATTATTLADDAKISAATTMRDGRSNARSHRAEAKAEARPARHTCTVSSGALLADLWSLVRSDLFVMAVSLVDAIGRPPLAHTHALCTRVQPAPLKHAPAARR